MNNLRFVILFITVLGACVIYLTRSALTVALVAMDPQQKNKTALSSPVNESTFTGDARPASHNCTPEIKDASVIAWLDELGSREHEYSHTTKGLLLSAFFATYILFQVPAGSCGKNYGPKWFMVASLTGSTVISLGTPFITDYTWLFIASRALLGVLQSVWFPCAFVLLMNWMPPSDQTFAIAAHTTGSILGSIITFTSSGFIVAYLDGWPSLFFVYGLSSLVVLIVTLSFVTSSPSNHPLITPQELERITDESPRPNTLQKSTSDLAVADNNNEICPASAVTSAVVDEDDEDGSRPPIPWCQIAKNVPYLITLFFTFTNGCINMLLYTSIPLYLEDILKDDTKNNGVVNGVIQAAIATSTLIIGYSSERVIERKILTRTSTRKTCGAICGYTQATCLIIIPFISNLSLIHGMLCLVGLFLGFASGAQYTLPSEMSKNFCAEMYAILNVTSVLGGLIVPNLVSLILGIFSEHQEIAWNVIFFSFAFAEILSTSLFVLLVSAERQPFDFITVKRNTLVTA